MDRQNTAAWAGAALLMPVVGCAGLCGLGQIDPLVGIGALLLVFAIQHLLAAASMVQSARGLLPTWAVALHVGVVALPWVGLAIAWSPIWFLAVPAAVLAIALATLGAAPLSEAAAGQAIVDAWRERPGLRGSFRRRTLVGWVGTLAQVPLVIPVCIGILAAGAAGTAMVGGTGGAAAVVNLFIGLAAAVGFVVLGIVPLTLSFLALTLGLTRPHYVRWLAGESGSDVGKRTGLVGLALDALAWFLFAAAAVITGATALLGPLGAVSAPGVAPLFILTAIRWHYYAAVVATGSGHVHGFWALVRIAVRHPRQLYISTVVQGAVLLCVTTIATLVSLVCFALTYSGLDGSSSPGLALGLALLAAVLPVLPLGWVFAPVLAWLSCYRLAVARRLPLAQIIAEQAAAEAEPTAEPS